MNENETQTPVVCHDCGRVFDGITTDDACAAGWRGFSTDIDVRQADGSCRREHLGRCSDCQAHDDRPAGKAEVRSTGKDPRQGNDIGVFVGGKCLQTFNSLSDDYAFSNARDAADRINQRRNEHGKSS